VLGDLRGTGITQQELGEIPRQARRSSVQMGRLYRGQPRRPSGFCAVATMDGDLQSRLQSSWKEVRNRIPPWLRGKFDPAVENSCALHTCALVQLACEAWWRLDDRMETLQALDFTDLEARAVRLLEKSEQTRNRLIDQFQVVMVDEAQDLNPVQHALLKSLGISQAAHRRRRSAVDLRIPASRSRAVQGDVRRKNKAPLKELSVRSRSAEFRRPLLLKT